MRKYVLFFFLFIIYLSSFSSEKARIASQEKPQPVKTTVIKTDSGWQLLRDGKPYYINGVGGHGYLQKAKEYGANSIRTWSTTNLKDHLDSAYRHGLTVCVGLWAQHERHGFDYDDEAAVAKQLKQFTALVKKYKGHPAILMWGIGNEVDLFYTNTNVWYAIQDIAKMVHEVDPYHPTMTVTAGIKEADVKLISERCPDIDILGINTYGGITALPQQVRDYGWKGPYVVAEWGPHGHWEVEKTKWGAPIEQTSGQKADAYEQAYQVITGDKEKCIGSYVFVWGNKQETTPTWYGLFLNTGEESEVMDRLVKGWSGKTRSNQAPRIKGTIEFNNSGGLLNTRYLQGAVIKASVNVTDPDGDPLTYKWVVMPESTDIKAGGDFEETPDPIEGLIVEQEGGKVVLNTPEKPGSYRLFMYAFDGNGNVATANVPFYIDTNQ